MSHNMNAITVNIIMGATMIISLLPPIGVIIWDITDYIKERKQLKKRKQTNTTQS